MYVLHNRDYNHYTTAASLLGTPNKNYCIFIVLEVLIYFNGYF